MQKVRNNPLAKKNLKKPFWGILGHFKSPKTRIENQKKIRRKITRRFFIKLEKLFWVHFRSFCLSNPRTRLFQKIISVNIMPLCCTKFMQKPIPKVDLYKTWNISAPLALRITNIFFSNNKKIIWINFKPLYYFMLKIRTVPCVNFS